MGLFDIFSNTDQQQAANAQIQGINTGLGQLNNYYTQGANALGTNYGQALQPWTQNYGQAQQGTNMLGNALGLNGPQGGASALQAFQQANPAYQFQLGQGLNAVNADNAAKGYLGSGNSAIGLNNYAQNFANQSYGNWVNQLQPYMGASNTAAAGLGNTYQGLGSGLAGVYTNQGNAAYGANASIGNANANAALGNLQASQNMWNVIGGVAGLGTKLAGFGGGGSGGGSPSLGNYAGALMQGWGGPGNAAVVT